MVDYSKYSQDLIEKYCGTRKISEFTKDDLKKAFQLRFETRNKK